MGHIPQAHTIHRAIREGRGPSPTDTRFTGLQGKGDSHLPWTQTGPRSTGERRGPFSTDTDDSQDYRGKERGIFHRHRRFTGLQGKGEGHFYSSLPLPPAHKHLDMCNFHDHQA